MTKLTSIAATFHTYRDHATHAVSAPARLLEPIRAWGRLHHVPWSWIAAATLIVLAAVALVSWISSGGSARSGSSLSVPVERGHLSIEVLAGGELESSDAVEVVCNVDAQELKILRMLPEGENVQQGDVVVWLDRAPIARELAQQEIALTQAQAAVDLATEELKIQRNTAESLYAQADLALTLAEMDRQKYLEGEYEVLEKDIKGAVALAEAALQEAKDELEYYRRLVQKGFATKEQLRAKEQAVMLAEYTVSSDQDKLRVLQQFTRERQLVELTAKAQQATRERERARQIGDAQIAKANADLHAAARTLELEQARLTKLEEQLAQCEVKAPTAGTVVYSKEKKKRIEVGAPVHFKQTLFLLPDMQQMQVRAYVHESDVKEVRIGQAADIRIDAYPDVTLTGAVTDVAVFYDSSRHWLSGGVKDYATTIRLDSKSQQVLKPGMTTAVRIKVAELDDVLLAPLTAVAQQGDRYVCYVLGRGSGAAKPRDVSLGRHSAHFVELREGIREGERVALDAKARVAEAAPVRAQRPAVPQQLTAQAGVPTP